MYIPIHYVTLRMRKSTRKKKVDGKKTSAESYERMEKEGKEVSNLSCVKRKNRAPLCGIKFSAPVNSHCHLAEKDLSRFFFPSLIKHAKSIKQQCEEEKKNSHRLP